MGGLSGREEDISVLFERTDWYVVASFSGGEQLCYLESLSSMVFDYFYDHY